MLSLYCLSFWASIISNYASQCPDGYFEQSGDIPGWGQVGGVGSGGSVSSCEVCADLCSQKSGCNSYECSDTANKCNLNSEPNPSQDPYHDYTFRTKDICPNGYYPQSGDIPGWGSVNGVGSGTSVSSCDACAQLCSQQSGCYSIECSPSDRKCNLNSAANPSQDPYSDYMFCSKDAVICPSGYVRQSGDFPGWGSVNGVGGGRAVSSCDECANLCSQQSGCNSFECSPIDLKCNLNSAADPSQDPYLDYMFCTKEQYQCLSGYFEQSGDIPGWGQVGGVGGGRAVISCDECDNLCSLQTGCNSFECSPTDLKCNLNTAANPSQDPYLDYIFCTKDSATEQESFVSNSASECPYGYFEQSGDIPGWGQVGDVGGGSAVSSCDECGNICSLQSGCNSFECSPTDLKCNLNTEADPSQDPYLDYMFCTKDSKNAASSYMNLQCADHTLDADFHVGDVLYDTYDVIDDICSSIPGQLIIKALSVIDQTKAVGATAQAVCSAINGLSAICDLFAIGKCDLDPMSSIIASCWSSQAFSYSSSTSKDAFQQYLESEYDIKAKYESTDSYLSEKYSASKVTFDNCGHDENHWIAGVYEADDNAEQNDIVSDVVQYLVNTGIASVDNAVGGVSSVDQSEADGVKFTDVMRSNNGLLLHYDEHSDYNSYGIYFCEFNVVYFKDNVFESGSMRHYNAFLLFALMVLGFIVLI